MAQRIIKVIIVGASGVGKTTYIRRLKTGDFITKCPTTMGVEVQRLNINNTQMNIWDCAGQKRFMGLGEGYYIGAHAAIVMFSITNAESYREAKSLVNKVKQTCGKIPIILCGNKADDEHNRVVVNSNSHWVNVVKELDRFFPTDLSKIIADYSRISLRRKFKVTAYYEISAKSNYNFEEPFLKIIEKLGK